MRYTFKAEDGETFLDLAQIYQQGDLVIGDLIAYAKTIPPRIQPIAGSPEWFDGGPWSEWDDVARAVHLGYLTPEESDRIVKLAEQG